MSSALTYPRHTTIHAIRRKTETLEKRGQQSAHNSIHTRNLVDKCWDVLGGKVAKLIADDPGCQTIRARRKERHDAAGAGCLRAYQG